MNERHLSDDRLIEVCVSGSVRALERAHLVACSACEMRRASIVKILEEMDDAATSAADAAFPPDRLDRQRARIMQRVDHEGRPGRLITFPAVRAHTTLLMRSRAHARWAVAASVAAFVMGILAGHYAHELPLGEQRTPSQIVANESDPSPLRAVSTSFSEDEFLGQIELAAGNGPVALRPLDAMTPRAWEVPVR
jgi:hypothetical protein